MIWENVKMAFRSIAGNKLRTFLTMLGIIIGVGAVVTISSIGAGLKDEVGKQVGDLGANVIFVLPGQVISNDKNGKQSFNPTASIGTSTLTDTDVASIRKTQGVQAAAPLSLISGIVTHNSTPDPAALLLATTPTLSDVLASPKVSLGRSFKPTESVQFVAVLGPNARDTLFGKDAQALGQTISIRDHAFTVIGINAASGNNSGLSQSPGFDDAVFIPSGTVKTVTGQEPQIFRIAVKADSQSDVKPTVDRIKSVLKKNHGGQTDFSVLTQDDLLSTVSTILNALTSAIAAIASIALLVGGIGIMNMMLVSVTERTREIGLRKAVGATSRLVLLQFLIEAIVLSLLGGALGVGLALAGGTAAGHAIGITPVFATATIVTAFAISVGIGVIFGIAPAIKAARMKPIDALRYE